MRPEPDLADLGTQIRQEPEPHLDMGRTYFRITEQNITPALMKLMASINNAVSCYK